ncbi:MAG TPA: hypothetical protein VGK51_04215 [Actinomycetota bacterium]
MQLPPQVTLDNVLAVSAEIAAGGPPTGGISHAVIVDGGQVKIFDIWESEEAFEAFSRDRLAPAVQRLMGGADPGELPLPEVQAFEAHDVMAIGV